MLEFLLKDKSYILKNKYEHARADTR